MAQRTMTVTSATPIKSGTSAKGYRWTLRKVEATIDGTPVDYELKTFQNLPVGQEITVEVEKNEWTARNGKVYVSFLLKQVKQATPAPVAPVVPDGRYAYQDANGDWQLVRVWVGTKVSPPPVRVYAVKGTEEGTRLGQFEEVAALQAIAKDPGQAAIEFGHRTGSCSKCATELRVNLSRHLGIGPECMKHWFDRDTRLGKMRQGRAELRAEGIDPADVYDNIAVAA